MIRDLHFSYDQEADVLYIAFDKGRKATSVSLNDNIVLRFDPAVREAVGLTLLDFSHIARGEAVPLTRLAELPGTLREIVWSVITRPPVSTYLHIARTEAPVGTIPSQVSLPELIMAA